jgi:hypothetical protein
VTEFKSFNLFLNRMAKKKTTQGIGYINNTTEFDNLVTKVAIIITEEFNRTSDNATAINNVKRSIDNLVGRTRESFTKTDVYQVSYLMFYSILKDTAEAQNRTFKETQVNTLVAKLMTEGEYGNPSVVRRQTTDAKLTELRNRLFPWFVGGILGFANYVYNSLRRRDYQTDLNSVAQRIAVRGSRSTTTTRVSNRTRRTTTPRSTTPRSTTPRATTPAAAPSQVTESSRQVTAYQVPDLTSSSQLAVGVRESIKRFSETSDKKVKLELMAGAWRYRLLLHVIDRTSNNAVVKEDLKDSVRGVIIRIGDVYNPANERVKYSEALRYLGYVVYLLSSGKIRTAQKFHSTLLSGQTRAIISRKIIELGIGSRNNTVFDNFTRFIGGESTIYTIVARVMGGGPRIDIGQLRSALSGTFSAPTATVTEINVPGYTSEATPAVPAPPPPVDTLIRNMKITDEWDFGVEWEHFGLGLPKIKRAMAQIGQPLYPKYVPVHDFDSYDRAIKPGMFPNNKVNKGWWVLQVDGSVRRDAREPVSEFRNTKQEAIIDQLGRRHDTYEGEFVSPVLGGKRGLAIIKLVGNTLVNLGMRHNRTMGMHTHVTKRGFTRTNIKNLMYNYVAMEPMIEAMMEPNRRSTAPGQYNRSHFIQLGLNLTDSETTVKNKLKSNILDISDDQFYYNFGTSKQQAVNLKPFYGGNTIEFRQQGANFEADSVTMWIAFLFYFCQFSKKKRFTGFQWNNLVGIMPVGLASFWYNRIQDLTGKSPYELSFRK